MGSEWTARLVTTAILVYGILGLGNTALSQNFVVTGTVIDAQTRESLIGANVVIPGTAKGDFTNEDGRFRLANISKNKVAIAVSYLGYDSDTIDVLLQEGVEAELTIALQPETQILEQVMVTAEATGQTGALLDQKSAPNIKNVVDAEQIASFPDMNAAESVNRIPGITLQRDQGEGRYVQLRGTPPELSNFSINGEQIPSPEGDIRYVPLDVIPSDQLATIEITKALTPDMDGDGIGGNVNLITKAANDSIPEFGATLAGSYNNLRGELGGQTQISVGQRFNKLGVFLNGSYTRDNRASHNMEFRFNQSRFGGDTTTRIHYDDIQHRHYTITRVRTGLTGTIDYKFDERNQIFLRGVFNRFSDDEQRRRVRYNIGSGFLTSETSSREAKIERDIKDRVKIHTINNIDFSGIHMVGRNRLDYGIAYAVAREELPGRTDMTFENDLVNLSLDLTDPQWPVIEFPRPKDSATVNNWSDYTFDEMLRVQGYTEDNTVTTRLNFEVPFGPNIGEGFVKFGGKVRLKNKERDNVGQVYHVYYNLFAVNSPFDSIRQIYNLEGPDLTLDLLAGDFNETNLMNRGYELGATPDPDKVQDFLEFYPQNFKLEENDTKEESHSEDYFAEEDVFAGYAMAKFVVGRSEILGGLRYERTDIRYTGYDVQFRAFSDAFESIDTLNSKRRFEFWLPQLHYKYILDPSSNFRAAATFSYSRPNFEDILPYRQVEYDSREITQGNPDLDFAQALNVDLLYEKYYSRTGIVSGGVFYKYIKDFVYYFERRIFVENISRDGWYFVTTAENGLYANIFGAELTVNQYFDFLQGKWKNLGVYFNYTFTYSDAYIDQRTEGEERITMPGQAPHIVNLALFYDAPRVYLKLAASFQDDFLDELGIIKEWDIYYAKNLHLDFNMHYNISPTLRVFGNATNLTNTPLTYYQGEPDRVRQKEFYSWMCRFGLRFTL